MSKATLTGKISKAVISVEDGSGRFQAKWNASGGTTAKYLNSNEPSFFLDMNVVNEPYYAVRRAPAGIKNANIDFITHLAIKQNGNTGIGTRNPTERLDVSGNIKADDILLTTNNFKNRLINDNDFVNTLSATLTTESFKNMLATDSEFVNTLSTSLNTGVINIFNKVKNACSTVNVVIDGNGYTCSGSFITVDASDLQHGLFMTAAHCAMAVVNGLYVKASYAYVTNPINNKWVKVLPTNMYIDGVADIAIYKTNIDLSNNPEYALKLSESQPSTGDVCYICGNPGGFDVDSIAVGIIRDANYTEPGGDQVTDSLFISAPGIGGNSGSPILNTNGEIIGIFTFGMTGTETFGGGSNLWTIRKSLEVLKTFQDNKTKKYLGLNWFTPSAFTLQNSYGVGVSTFDNKGVYITQVSVESPFNGVLSVGDILLSITLNTSVSYDFGALNSQRTPGVICYEYNASSCSITYLKASNKTVTTTNGVLLNKTYSNVVDIKDAPLSGGLITRELNKIDIK